MTDTRERVLRPDTIRVFVIASAVVLALFIPPVAKTVVRIRFLYSDDAKGVVAKKVDQFNELDPRTPDGRTIVVDAASMPSGVVVNRMCESGAATDCEQPAIWLPAATTWLRLLGPTKDWGEDGPTSILQSPQVLAMWKGVPKGLKVPVEQISFSDVMGSDLTFAHAAPDSSTSGFHSALAEFSLSGSESSRAPTEAAILNGMPQVRSFEQTVGAICIKSSDLLDRKDPRQLFDVAYLQETTFATYNSDRGADRPALVASYPKDANYVGDYPLTVLSGAPWMQKDPALLEATGEFKDWLVHDVTLSDADANLFRTSSGDVGPTLKRWNGGQTGPVQPKPPPDGDVLSTVQELWPSTQRPLDVAIVIDSSEALGPHLSDAKAALASLEDHLDDGDHVLTIRGQKPTGTDLQIAKGDWRTPLRRQIDSLQANGGPPQLWAEIKAGLKWLDPAHQSRAGRVLVVLTTGNTSEKILPNPSADDARIFVIGMGVGSQTPALQDLADESGGRYITSDFVAEMVNVAEGC
jgi:Bacterial extracellular solute-binding protein/von Willebrand factor type A domain